MSIDGRNWVSNTTTVVLDWSVVSGTTTKLYTEDIGVVQRFNYTTNQQFDRIHGAGYREFNYGVVRKPPSYEWTMEIFISSKSIRALRALMSSKHPFKITADDSAGFPVKDAAGATISTVNLKARENELMKEMLDRCYVTSMDTSYASAEAPTITFSGVAFVHDFEYYDADNATQTVLELDGTLGSGTINAGAVASTADWPIDLPTVSSLFEDDWDDAPSVREQTT